MMKKVESGEYEVRTMDNAMFFVRSTGEPQKRAKKPTQRELL